MDFNSKQRERPAEFTDSYSCWEALSCAIIRQACRDYKEGLGRTRREVESFIQSEYFQRISNIDPDYLIKNLRETFKPMTGMIKG